MFGPQACGGCSVTATGAVWGGGSVQEARFVSHDDCLGSVPYTEFAVQMCDVRLDGGLADVEPIGDFGVRQPVRNEHQDLTLAGGELGEAAGLDRGPAEAQ